jgi:hypothetical protein
MFERDWATKSGFIYHSTLKSETQVGGPMCLVKVRNQQTCTSNRQWAELNEERSNFQFDVC